ncbi:hypothetical protein KCU89_g113, partial [Aureobasidium melanogenum]
MAFAIEDLGCVVIAAGALNRLKSRHAVPNNRSCCAPWKPYLVAILELSAIAVKYRGKSGFWWLVQMSLATETIGLQLSQIILYHSSMRAFRHAHDHVAKPSLMGKLYIMCTATVAAAALPCCCDRQTFALAVRALRRASPP